MQLLVRLILILFHFGKKLKHNKTYNFNNITYIIPNILSAYSNKYWNTKFQKKKNCVKIFITLYFVFNLLETVR